MYKIIGADGREYGPVSADQLRQWIGQGRANAQTRVAAEGSSEWLPLGSLPEFAASFAPAPAPAPAAVVAPSVRKIHPFAITGMVLGILSLLFCCCCGLPFNIPGLIFSIIALVQIRDNPQLYDGNGMAIAGLVLSLLSLVAGTLLHVIGGESSSWNQMMREM